MVRIKMILVAVGAIYDEAAQTISDRYCSAPTWRGLKLMLPFRSPLERLRCIWTLMFNFDCIWKVFFENVDLEMVFIVSFGG